MDNRKTLFTVLLLAGLIAFWQLGTCELRNAENRWAAVAQTMYESGNIFIMQAGQQDYYDKPYLSYWLILACSYVAGGVNEWTIRLPSALAGVLAVLLTYLLALRMLGARAAWVSALVFMTSLGFVNWARHGQVEMLNLFAILAVLYVFLTCKESDSPRWLYGMAAIMAVGSWLKGPLCYAVPGMAILLHSLLFKDWKWLRIGHVMAAGVVSLGIYFVPFVFAWLSTGRWDALYMVYRENVLRLVAPFDHVKPLSYYLPSIPLLALPWSVWLPWFICYLVLEWRKVPRQLKQIMVIGAGVLLFYALSSSRRHYYLIPALPFVSMLFAAFLAALPELGKKWKVSIAALLLFVGSACCVPLLVIPFISADSASTALQLYLDMEHESSLRVAAILVSWSMCLLALLMTISGGAMAVLSWQTLRHAIWTDRHLLVWIGSIYIAIAFPFAALIPYFDQLRGQRDLIRTISKVVPPDQEIALFTPDGQENASMVFYLQKYRHMKLYRVFRDLDSARQELTKSGGLLLCAEGPLGDASGWQQVAVERYVQFRSKSKDVWILYRPANK